MLGVSTRSVGAPLFWQYWLGGAGTPAIVPQAYSPAIGRNPDHICCPPLGAGILAIGQGWRERGPSKVVLPRRSAPPVGVWPAENGDAPFTQESPPAVAPFPEPTYAQPGEGEGWWWDSLLGAWISPGGFVAYPEGEAGFAREQYVEQLPGDPFFGDISPPPTPPADKLKVVGTVAVVGLLLLALTRRKRGRG